VSQETRPLILAVDDEAANVKLLERLLGKSNRVMGATNGQDALDMLAQAPFDLVLLDIMMPDMDGLEVLRRMRANPKTADLPAIMISALSDARYITRGLEIGANDYITKPIDPDVTRARVNTQLRLKRLEDERKNTIEQLQAAQEMKDRLLRIASHDLKNPIANVSIVVSLLRQSEVDIPSGDILLDALDKSVETMKTVIEDFLDTAALQSGALNMRLEAVALEPVIDELIAQFTPHAARKNITLLKEDVTGAVHADPSRFEQALGNLVSNAIKYSPNDTTVRLWTECAQNVLRVCVCDQGPGIPEHDQSRLFTQFGKLTPRPTGGESSTGLGLWIVKHLISLQNGNVGVYTPPEGGSIFWIEMPLA
jgi:two-component system, sensor histidine kinase and response regulator